MLGFELTISCACVSCQNYLYSISTKYLTVDFDAVPVDHDSILLKKEVDVRVEPFLSSLAQEDENRTPALEVLLQIVDLGLGELFARPG